MALALLTACSDSPKPANPEPKLQMLPAEDITRTEAKIYGRVDSSAGVTRLNYLRFCYSADLEGVDTKTVELEVAEQVEARLSGLTPATRYRCYLEGGTATATLRSEPITFTTVSNNVPKVSKPSVLSAGPIGLIIEFEIVDNGGESVTAAGCELADNSTGARRDISLEPYDLIEGKHRMTIGALQPLTSYTLTPYATNSIGRSEGEALEYTTHSGFVLTEAGSLPKLFAGTESINFERLSISGPVNGTDIRYLRMLLGAEAMPGVKVVKSAVTNVELTDARIVAGGEPYDGSHATAENIIGVEMFASCKQLKSIELPENAERMSREALADCPALERILIPAAMTSLTPSTGCPALKTIDVSGANTSYRSVDGVLYNRSVSEIVWFPLGKTGQYRLPATITAIAEKAFYGTSFAQIIIPESVTSVGRAAFADSKLESVAIPDKVNYFAESLFQNCLMLREVTIGKSVDFIGGFSFQNAPVVNIYLRPAVPPAVAETAFDSSIFTECTLHVPAGKKAIYRNHPVWGKFIKIIENE